MLLISGGWLRTRDAVAVPALPGVGGAGDGASCHDDAGCTIAGDSVMAALAAVEAPPVGSDAKRAAWPATVTGSMRRGRAPARRDPLFAVTWALGASARERAAPSARRPLRGGGNGR